MVNADINNSINPTGSHTAQLPFSSTSIGGRMRRKYNKRLTRRYKSCMNKKSRKSRKSRKSQKSRRSCKSRKNRRQNGGLNPTYRAYSASFEPGRNGMYANGPSVGNIIEQFN